MKWGLPVLAASAFVWLLANLGEVRIVQEFALISIIVVLVWTLLGPSAVRVLRFPLAFLFLAVPFGISLIRPLQTFTAWFAIHAITLSGIPAILENHTILLPTGQWMVAEACSGIRFLLSSIVIGMIFASLAYRCWKRRIAFVCASVVVPIIANGLRAYGIIVLAYSTNNKIAAGVDHVVYGGVFAVVIQFFLIAVGLKWKEPNTSEATPRAPTTPPAEQAQPWISSPLIAISVTVTIMVVLLAPAVGSVIWRRTADSKTLSLASIAVNPPWRTTNLADFSWVLKRQDTEQAFSGSFTDDSNRIDLYYSMHSGRREVNLSTDYDPVNSSNPWDVVAESNRDAVVNGQNIRIRQRTLAFGRTSRLVWTWYAVDGQYTGDLNRVKLMQGKARLLGKSANLTVIDLGMENPQSLKVSGGILQDFLTHASLPGSDASGACCAKTASSNANRSSPLLNR